MPIDWRVVYEGAMLERSPGKVKAVCEHARRVIVDRLLELRHEPADTTLGERLEIEEASRALALHEWSGR